MRWLKPALLTVLLKFDVELTEEARELALVVSIRPGERAVASGAADDDDALSL